MNYIDREKREKLTKHVKKHLFDKLKLPAEKVDIIECSPFDADHETKTWIEWPECQSISAYTIPAYTDEITVKFTVEKSHIRNKLICWYYVPEINEVL